ncbi:hypothetical protein DL93DRAFT_2049515 [Clavulina sp. PMI_390]|nr:hypothetical protein DL93DRAFT_2049515 [Clavulina sp. PMI_390]
MFVAVHYSATDFLDAAEPALARREREGNCILPLAQAYRDHEIGHNIVPRKAQTPWERARVLLHPEWRDDLAEFERVAENRQFWLTLWSFPSPASTEPSLDLILSCTASHIANLPIFLWCSYETSTLTPEYLVPRMTLLVQHLAELVPYERVFSVFAPNLLTKSFAQLWTSKTGANAIAQPYYSAALTYVTRNTLTPTRASRVPSLPPLPFVLRQAHRGDAAQVASHCFEFAEDSDFPIDRPGSIREALHYINNRQMWVCAVEVNGHEEIASIVAVTRNTLRNATITKVHTAATHRKRGYAESLVRHVCEHLLFDTNIFRRHALDHTGPYEAVSLYVAHDNVAAATVYDRVGFAGLLGKPRPSGVEDVLELGFEGAIKGYW